MVLDLIDFSNGLGRNCIIFGAGMNSSVHVYNKKKYILILGKGPTQGVEDTALTAEKLYKSILLKKI